MRFSFDIRKRLGRKRAGRVGVCVLERWSPVTKRATYCRPA